MKTYSVTTPTEWDLASVFWTQPGVLAVGTRLPIYKLATAWRRDDGIKLAPASVA
jgi:hypothetical protein